MVPFPGLLRGLSVPRKIYFIGVYPSKKVAFNGLGKESPFSGKFSVETFAFLASTVSKMDVKREASELKRIYMEGFVVLKRNFLIYGKLHSENVRFHLFWNFLNKIIVRKMKPENLKSLWNEKIYELQEFQNFEKV